MYNWQWCQWAIVASEISCALDRWLSVATVAHHSCLVHQPEFLPDVNVWYSCVYCKNISMYIIRHTRGWECLSP